MHRVLSATATVLLAGSVSAQTSTHSLGTGGASVYNLVGTVRVLPGSGSSITAEVRRSGPDASQVRVETSTIDGRSSLRVVFPATEISYRGMGDHNGTTSMSVREDGTFGDGHRGGRRVRITSRSGGLNAHAEVTVRGPAGKSIAVFIGVGEATVENVNGDIVVDASSANVRAVGTSGRLRLDTGSGRVRVENASGDLSLDTGSGDVDLVAIRGGRVVVDAGSGSLRGDDIEALELSADLGSGGTRLTRVKTRNLSIDSGSGSVDVQLLTDVDRAVIDNGSGSVTLRLPANIGATLEIETGSGGIDSDFPLTLSSRSRSHLRATIGDGQGRITIDTGSGGVRLRRN
jgi:lia operon protein LiaG